MNRRIFLKKGALASLYVMAPFSLLKGVSLDADYSVEELTGQARPSLYGEGFNLRKPAADAFQSLIKAAEKDGFRPYVVSSYRSFSHQKGIWERKYKRFTQQGLSPQKAIEKIVLYSTIPGTSRHHWGTDLDIVDGKVGVVDNPLHEKHFNKGGVYAPFKEWLNEYAQTFDFYEVYTAEKGRKGFAYEPWHFSYKPTACEMLNSYTLLDFKKLVKGFKIKGSEYFTDELLQSYYNENILDINPKLLPF